MILNKRSLAGMFILLSLLPAFLSCSGSTTARRESPDLDGAVEQYKARNYDQALLLLSGVIEYRGTKTEKRVEALKLRAFIYAMQQREDAAREEFLKAFALNHDFALDKAEIGNPFWTPPFEAARRQAELLYLPPAELTARALTAYLKRDYTTALEQFTAALNGKNITSRDKLACYKYTAFIHALHHRPNEARQAFRRAFETDSRFSLDKGEYGNPLWTPLFDEVQKNLKK
jgi:Tfp pilus assembly protein PilF